MLRQSVAFVNQQFVWITKDGRSTYYVAQVFDDGIRVFCFGSHLLRGNDTSRLQDNPGYPAASLEPSRKM